LAATLVAMGLIAAALMDAFDHEHRASELRTAIERIAQAVPPPRLQVEPEADLNASNGAAEARLNSFGWVDRRAGIAHIPIDDAMHRLTQQGWPSQRAAP
jgi:hypothetical protein